MNIALLIPELGGGGAERVAQIIGNYYVEQGNHVYYFLADCPVKQAYPVKGQIIHTGIKSCRYNNTYGDIQAIANLIQASFTVRKYKKKYKIDVAISFMEEWNYLNILSKGREKVIARIGQTLSQCSVCSGVLYRKKIVKFFYCRADKVVVLCNDGIRDMHEYYKVPLKKMVKIPNPVLQVPDNRSKTDWPYGDKVIIAVGRLVWQKQQERIIRAFSYVSAYEEEAKLLILGQGEQEKYLRNLCERYNLKEKVIFIGFQNDVAYYLQNSKVYVMSSEVEGMPNSMLEAMANGLPVVTTDSPGACGELVGKKKAAGKCTNIEYCPYGILTPHILGKVQAGKDLEKEELLLGQAMLELIRNEKLCRKYSERSRQRASMYNIEKIMSKWNQLIK